MVAEGTDASVVRGGLQAVDMPSEVVLLNSRNSLVIFAIAFAYTLLAALTIETFVLPVLLPQLHAGHGLMVGHDSVGFHALADEMATRIQAHGWHEWQLAPDLQGAVGISAAIYALTGVHEPLVLIPIYSVLYAVSVTCVYRIVRILSGSESGAWIAAAAFLLFPSATMIYAEPHKDAWSCAGVLLLIAAWVEIEARKRASFREVLCFVVACGLAIALIWLVRPYLIKLTMGGLLSGTIALMLANAVRASNWRRDAMRYAGYLFVLAAMATISVWSSAPLMNPPVPRNITSAYTANEPHNVPPAGRIFTHAIGSILSVREGVAHTRGGSVVDKNVEIRSFMDLALYLPRALQIGLLSPFPNMWLEHGMTAGARLMRLVSGAEMSIAYFLLLGFFFLVPSIRRDRIAPFLFVIVTCLAVLDVMGLAMPNIGTLYRMRYPIFMLVIGLGSVGWAILLAKIRARNKPASVSRSN